MRSWTYWDRKLIWRWASSVWNTANAASDAGMVNTTDVTPTPSRKLREREDRIDAPECSTETLAAMY